MLYKSTKSVSVGSNQDFLARLDGWCNFIFPNWHESIFGEFKAFGFGQICFIDIGIAGIVPGVVLTGFITFGRWNVVATSPNQYLIFAMFVYGFLFVESLKSTIVTFIEAPSVDLQIDMHKLVIVWQYQ
jgi:hypothetical protein